MARYRTSIQSPLPADAAFDAVADFTTVADWDPGVRDARRVDEGPLDVGAEFDVDVMLAGRAVTFRYAITEYERPRRVVLLAERSPFRSLDTIAVTGDDGGSTVTYDAELTLTGLARLAEPLLALGFARVGDRAAEGLRRHLSGRIVA